MQKIERQTSTAPWDCAAFSNATRHLIAALQPDCGGSTSIEGALATHFARRVWLAQGETRLLIVVAKHFRPGTCSKYSSGGKGQILGLPPLWPKYGWMFAQQDDDSLPSVLFLRSAD